MKPAAATVLTLALLFADTVLKNIPYFESLKDWFLTEKMSVWVRVFEYRIPWEMMVEAIRLAAGHQRHSVPHRLDDVRAARLQIVTTRRSRA